MKFIQQRAEQKVTRGREREKWELLFDGYRCSLVRQKVLEYDLNVLNATDLYTSKYLKMVKMDILCCLYLTTI